MRHSADIGHRTGNRTEAFSDHSRNIRRSSTIDVAHVVRASIRRRDVTHLRLCASLLCSSRLAYRHISRLKVPTASWARP